MTACYALLPGCAAPSPKLRTSRLPPGGSLLCTRTNEELWEVIDVFFEMEGLDFFVSTLVLCMKWSRATRNMLLLGTECVAALLGLKTHCALLQPAPM